MAIIAPESNLYERLFERIEDKVPEIRYAAQEMGQLEHYEMRPAVSWPCLLIDLDDFTFTDAQNALNQLAQGIVVFRLGLLKLTDLNNLTPANIRSKGYTFTELENKLYQALHGWAPEGFGRLIRRKALTEKREDDIRVKVVTYSISYTDESASPKRITVPRPGVTIGQG